MAELPYMTGYGVIPKILDKMIEAKTPERFTQDFLATKLGFPGGSRMPMIPLLKKIGFIESSGAPTLLYNKFRSDALSRGIAMAEGIRRGYSELYAVSEYAHELSKDKLKAQIIQLTGDEKNSPKVNAIVCTFEALKPYANFDGEDVKPVEIEPSKPMPAVYSQQPDHAAQPQNSNDLKMHIGYNIHLNLPESKDVEVFNAIFKALKQNLLS